MNVERLRSLLLSAIRDIEDSNSSSLLGQLREWTQRLANNPQDANAQREFVTRRSALVEALRGADSNSFSPGTTSDLHDVGISGILGNGLAERIERVFDQNEFTLAVASDEISEIERELGHLYESLTSTVSVFETLGIRSEEPAPGDVEVSVILPKSSDNNSLESLGKEFRQLERLFSDIVELATGSRTPTVIRSIASSDYGVYIEFIPAAAALLAVALERVIAVYKNLLEIRKLRSEIAARGVSDESLTGIDEHINSLLDQGLEQVVDLVLEGEMIAISDESRKNELRNSLKRTLNQFASRIDRGYRFDIRIGELTEPDDDEEESESRMSDASAMRVIAEHRESLQSLQLDGKPILQLPSSEPDDE